MNKFLLFTTGGGSASIMNLDSSEVALYNSVDLRTIKPADKSSLDLFFETNQGTEVVTLKIKAASHGVVMRSIAEAINSEGNIIKVADVDTNTFIDGHISGCSIKRLRNYVQTLANNSRIQVSVPSGIINSCLIANIDGSAAVDLTLELHDGTTYTKLLSTVSIPADTTLKLESDEISFDNSIYNLFATSGDSDGQLTFTFNY